jgi:FAD/FMN-containing dehydrogenase
MMMGSQGSMGTAEIVAEATKLAMPAETQRVLKGIGSQLAALQDRQNEIIALQQKTDADRAAVDKHMAELQQRAAVLDARDATLSTRAAKFDAVVAAFEQKLAAHAASLEQTP